VVTQVIQTVADPRSSVKDLNRIINLDVTLTATILRVANSPLFGFSRKVGSLEQALQVLGFTEVQNLILTKAVFNSFRNVRGSGSFDIRRFWEHAFLCGLAARLLGKTFGVKGTDVFVAGLIHDIGKLVLYMALPAQFCQIFESAGAAETRTFRAEQNLIGYGHDKVGMDLLQRWMFPKSLVTAVGFHHRPKEAPEYPVLTIAVHLADIMAHLSSEQSSTTKDAPAREELLYPDCIAMCRSHGLEWNDSVCRRVSEELVESREQEAATIGVLFS
jgi:HD-like signal output (HDOD) protein